MRIILRTKIFVSSILTKIKKRFEFGHISWIRTLWVNFHYLPFSQAKHFPIYVRNKIIIRRTSAAKFIIDGQISRGMIEIGGSGGPNPGSIFTAFDLTNGLIVFHGKAKICSGSKLMVFNGGKIDIGDNVLISNFVLISSEKQISIGNNCRIAHYAQIFDTSFHFIESNGIVHSNCAPVNIGDNCWLANHITISKGVSLPPFTIVGQNTLVNKNICNEEGCLVVGSPAKVIRTGLKRIIDKTTECTLKNYFKSDPSIKSINLKDLMI